MSSQGIPSSCSGESGQLMNESIVISGMSGAFPNAHNVKEFADILYKKINPVILETEKRQWSHPEYSGYMGQVPDVDRFDSRFFMVHHYIAQNMDPMAKKVLEHSYQALYDAGVNPKHLNGRKVGVFIASALSEIEMVMTMTTKTKMGSVLTGGNKTMYANRISYWLNAKGPSITIDDACCGFTVALQEAYSAMTQGLCEAAIVGGASVGLFPVAQVHYSRCIKMSPDEKTKSFDQDANGCAKSSAITILFLQKAKDALRVYAELVHVKNEHISKLSGEMGQQFGFIRDPNATAGFLEQFYEEAKVKPQSVEYVEAFGSATPEADRAELQALEKVFCNNRIVPLFVGSVISNIGYTESASGGTAITKVLLGYHKGMLASNLHCETPRQDVAAIRDGRMCVLRDHLPFRGSLTAVNCLSVTGVNSHVLLRGWTKAKDVTKYKTSIPKLVVMSARQEENLTDIFDDFKSRPIDCEELALLNNIHTYNIPGNLGRGYIILDDMKEANKTISLSEEIAYFDDTQRPLWFVYSGMGSQWAGMGEQLMSIPIFAAAVERCHKALEPKGIDIVDIIKNPDASIFDNILHSFVGIAAIQIGLTDILFALGLHPDKIIGHSVGELGCAYADGCLSTEEMILSAYSRGMASLETPLIRGAMAAVGLGYTQLSRLCPPEIEIACHNGPDSSTISGPEESLRKFVALLTAKGIFAKEVPCSHIAYHSRYIADAGPNLSRRCSEIISEPRARSDRWVSTSVPRERWDEPLAKYCSAEYLTNNLLSSVYFAETCRLIPSNAVLIEIAPHGLLQAILRRSLPPSCTNIPLTKRGHKNNVISLLEAIGKLFIEGYNPKVQALYPKVEFPVSIGTPHLSHLAKWYHSEVWSLPLEISPRTRGKSCFNFAITIQDDEYSYLKGNVIQGRVLYPFAATLVAVWDTLALSNGLPKKGVSVRFNHVHLYTQPLLHDQKSLKLSIALNIGNGLFEVLDGDSKVATGYIFYIPKSVEDKNGDTITPNDLKINSADIYEHLCSRGYSYREQFRSIHSVDECLSQAQMVWKNNWVTLIDGLLQLNILRHAHEGITQSTYIREINIDIDKHVQKIKGTTLDAKIYDALDRTRCGGVTIQNIKYRNVISINDNKFKLIPMLSVHSTDHLKSQLYQKKTPIALHIGHVGDLDTLQWKEDMIEAECGIKVMVECAGINVTDVNKATNAMPIEEFSKYYGLDFSGWSESGERVMGVCPEGSARSVVVARSELVWPVPAHWSLEDAATVPLAYLQAYYCLFIKYELKSGSRVLIHGGAGALGQAAISIALARGCQVFMTVSSSAKKKFLLKMFPELNANYIGNSRDESFGDMVLSATKGRGCHVILGCVRGNLKNISLTCAGGNGYTFDTDVLQNRENYNYGMFFMTKSRSYIAIEMNSVFHKENPELQRKLQTLVSEGIVSGEVRPLSRVQYSAREAARAFRLLAASQHRGRVLLRLTDHDSVPQHSFSSSTNSTHMLIWDGSLLGLQFLHRLVSRGVKNIQLILCTKPASNHRMKTLLWQKMGVDVQILPENLARRADNINKMISDPSFGQIEGIYVIASAALDEKQNAVMVDIVEALDQASRKLCPLLRYFCIVTAQCDFGNKTWTSRYKDGYPVTALSLPPYVDDNISIGCDLGAKFTWIQSVVDAIEQALGNGIPVQIARPRNKEKLSLVSLIPGFTGKESIDCTLQDLALPELLPMVKSLLNDVYQVWLDDEDILKLTKKRIQDIEMNSKDRNFNVFEKKGLGTFFSSIHLDELNATAGFIPLDVNGIANMDYGIDVTQDYLFIIPGLEGNYERFITLCQHLDLPAIVLQPEMGGTIETPQDYALRHSKLLLEKFKLKKTINLLAYECGIFAALELTGILEDSGLTGTVFVIGDGPEEMKGLLEEELSSFSSEEELQDGVVTHMVSLMRGAAAEARRGGPWSARLDAAVRALLGRVPHTAQYVRALLEAAYSRIQTARSYNVIPRALRSRFVLMLVQRSKPAQECNSLQKYSNDPLYVENLTAPMKYAAYDLKAPATINSYLALRLV